MKIEELTKIGYTEARHGDGLSLSRLKDKNRRGMVQKQKAPTLQCNAGVGVLLECKVRPCLTPERTEKRQNGRRFKEDGEPMFTLTSQDRHGVAIEMEEEGKTVERIRVLTPREYWRLMGFSDEAFDRASQVVSKSQLYKQAGNSIVVPVLEAIFTDLYKKKQPKMFTLESWGNKE